MPRTALTKPSSPKLPEDPAPEQRWDIGSPNATQPARMPRRGANPWRKMLKEECNPEVFRHVVHAMVLRAQGGDVQAAKLIFDHLMGTPAKFHIIEQVAALEQILGIADTEEPVHALPSKRSADD